jgi:hypothetical protein
MYRFTKDVQYLEQAKKIAAFLLQHPNLPKDKIPYWDFNAPDIPNAKRDASAGSIMASALLELAQYTKGKEAKCGEKGKEAKCGEKGKEGKCGEKAKKGSTKGTKTSAKGKEAKCGEKGKEGKCGEKGKEAKCGEKGKEGKCGEKPKAN